jgi:hypothetical protein
MLHEWKERKGSQKEVAMFGPIAPATLVADVDTSSTSFAGNAGGTK